MPWRSPRRDLLSWINQASSVLRWQQVDENYWQRRLESVYMSAGSDENDNFEDYKAWCFEETEAHVEDDSNFEGAFISPLRMQYTQSLNSICARPIARKRRCYARIWTKNGRSPLSSGWCCANQCKNANALIATSCKVMVGMREMCKDEMATAKKADADRDTIDSCLDGVKSVHGRQRKMLTTLHEKLLEFSGSWGHPDQRPTIILSSVLVLIMRYDMWSEWICNLYTHVSCPYLSNIILA
jgi:hypothetical protein